MEGWIPVIYDDEAHTIVKTYLELPVLLDIIETDSNKMKAMNLKLGPLYILYLKSLQKQILKEINEIRKTMRTRGIRILHQKRLEDRIEAKYICRGYEKTISLLNGKLISDSEVKLAELMNVNITDIERG